MLASDVIQAQDGSVALVEIYPTGDFAGTPQDGIHGFTAQSARQWGFAPQNNFLRFQCLPNGFPPFNLGMIQGQQNGAYVAMGTYGKMYFFSA